MLSKAPKSINQIEVRSNGKVVTRTFLPIFDDQLTWAEDAKCGDDCPLACHNHPLVADDVEPHTYHLLCTLTAIRAGLVTKKEIVTGGR